MKKKRKQLFPKKTVEKPSYLGNRERWCLFFPCQGFLRSRLRPAIATRAMPRWSKVARRRKTFLSPPQFSHPPKKGGERRCCSCTIRYDGGGCKWRRWWREGRGEKVLPPLPPPPPILLFLSSFFLSAIIQIIFYLPVLYSGFCSSFWPSRATFSFQKMAKKWFPIPSTIWIKKKLAPRFLFTCLCIHGVSAFQVPFYKPQVYPPLIPPLRK